MKNKHTSMKKTSVLIMLCLSLTVFAYSQKDSIRGNQYNLTGKLISDFEPTPFCGYIAWASVLEFEVLNISGTNQFVKNISIIVTCPEIYSANYFIIGKTYHVSFSDKNQADFAWAIINQDRLKKNNVSFNPYLLTVKKIE